MRSFQLGNFSTFLLELISSLKIKGTSFSPWHLKLLDRPVCAIELISRRVGHQFHLTCSHVSSIDEKVSPILSKIHARGNGEGTWMSSIELHNVERKESEEFYGWFRALKKSPFKPLSVNCAAMKNENTFRLFFFFVVINQKSRWIEDDVAMMREADKCHKSVFWSRERHQEK